jgi:hypothetical protein
LGDVVIYEKKILPAKIRKISRITEDAIRLELRSPLIPYFFTILANT